MKIIILIIIFISLLFGCASKTTIEFCEGVSTKGDGVNCGEKFSTGDLTAIIKPARTFGVDTLTINIYKNNPLKKEKINTLQVKVKQDDLTVKTNLLFYDEGKFVVEVIGLGKQKIAEGVISIIDTY